MMCSGSTASEGLSTDVITDFGAGDSIELVDDTGSPAAAQITSDASGSTVTWDELTIVLDVVIDYDDINPISNNLDTIVSPSVDEVDSYNAWTVNVSDGALADGTVSVAVDVDRRRR